jgi:hypothetical protein
MHVQDSIMLLHKNSAQWSQYKPLIDDGCLILGPKPHRDWEMHLPYLAQTTWGRTYGSTRQTT